MSLTELVPKLRDGSLSLLTYIDQLEAVFNEREPSVLSFVPEDDRFGRLRTDAQQLLEKYPDPADRPPLFGVPIGVKDIFHVDGFLTRANTNVPVEVIQGEQSIAVGQLLEQGALIMGKTVTTEFAYFGPGPTMNPYNGEHTPGGSSSGSAAAAGAGICPLTFGTQTIGSINRPGAFCGTVGWKPSYDRVSRDGVIPLSESYDHIGLFATTAADIALAAQFIVAGWDSTKAASNQLPTLGVPKGPYLARASSAALAQFESDCVRLADAGYTILQIETMADFDEIVARHQATMAFECAQQHKRWYADYPDGYHPKTIGLIEKGLQVSAEKAQSGRDSRKILRDQLTASMSQHNIDFWVTPSAVDTAPHGLGSTGDPIMQLPWTHAGLPSVNVPSAIANSGLPYGFQIVGGWWQDEKTISHAEKIRQIIRPIGLKC